MWEWSFEVRPGFLCLGAKSQKNDQQMDGFSKCDGTQRALRLHKVHDVLVLLRLNEYDRY